MQTAKESIVGLDSPIEILYIYASRATRMVGLGHGDAWTRDDDDGNWRATLKFHCGAEFRCCQSYTPRTSQQRPLKCGGYDKAKYHTLSPVIQTPQESRKKLEHKRAHVLSSRPLCMVMDG